MNETDNFIDLTPSLLASTYNTDERVKAACKEHTAFTEDDIKNSNGRLLVLNIGEDLEFDFKSLTTQPRIYNIDTNTVTKYANQCDGTLVGTKTIHGIREPISVVKNCLAGKPPFLGKGGHHRTAAAVKKGYTYIIAEPDYEWDSLSYEEKQDRLMSDNAHPSNGKQNTQQSVKKQLSNLYGKESKWKRSERQKLAHLQARLDNENTSDTDRKTILEQIKTIRDELVESQAKKAKKWMPDKNTTDCRKVAGSIFNTWRMEHEAKLHSHTRKEIISAINKDRENIESDIVYVSHGIGITNNNIIITAPFYKAAEQIISHQDDKKNKKNSLPAKLDLYIHIPSGLHSLKHLFEMRKRYYEQFEKFFTRIGGVYELVPRRYKFIGQVLTAGEYQEDTETFYDIDYVNDKLEKLS